MQTKNNQEENSLCLCQHSRMSDVVCCETISCRSVSAYLTSNYKLCQDLIKIANDYLSKQNSLQYCKRDVRDVMIDSEHLLKSLAGRISQNIFPEANSFQKKEEFSQSDISTNEDEMADDGTTIIMANSKKINKNTKKTKKSKNSCSLGGQYNLKSKKDYWTSQEDAQLLNLLETHGKKWTKIGRIIGGRTGKQVRDRYLNKLRPDIKEENWSEEEDSKFLSLYRKFGKRWCQIASFLPGRTENQVKNRFYSRIMKNLKLLSSGSQEDPSSKSSPQGFYSDETTSVFEAQNNEEREKTIESFFSKDLALEYIDPQDFFCKWEDQIDTDQENRNSSSSNINDFL